MAALVQDARLRFGANPSIGLQAALVVASRPCLSVWGTCKTTSPSFFSWGLTFFCWFLNLFFRPGRTLHYPWSNLLDLAHIFSNIKCEALHHRQVREREVFFVCLFDVFLKRLFGSV